MSPTCFPDHRRVLSLAIPLALAGISTPVLSLIETAVVGHLPDSHALGAVALGTMVFNYVYWAFSFLRMSTTALSAQALGAGRADEVQATLARAVLVALVIGSAIVAIASPLRWLAFTLMPASQEVRSHAETYVAIRIWSVPAAFTSYALLGFFMGLQRPRLAMVMEVLRGAIYVPVAFVLVRKLDWGVAGVASASVAAEWVSVIASICVALVLLSRRRAPWRWRAILDRAALWRLFTVNRDLFVRTQCLLLVFATFAARGAAMGDDILAANAVLMNLYLLISYALGAFAQAASALVGTAVGAGELRAQWRAIRVTTAWAVGFAVASSTVLLVAGHWVVGALTDLEPVRAVAHVFLPYAVAMPIVAVLSFQLDGAAIGATRTGLLRNVLIVALLAYGAAHLSLVPLSGNHGLWISFGVFMLVRSSGFFLFVAAIRKSMH